MGFRVFEEYGAASRPEATLRTSSYLFLSKGIMKRAHQDRPSHAVLLYDETNDRLGIELFSGYDAMVQEAAKEVSVEKSGIAVNLAALIRYYDLPDPRIVGKHVLPVTFEDGMIVIDMSAYRFAVPKISPDPNDEDDL